MSRNSKQRELEFLSFCFIISLIFFSVVIYLINTSEEFKNKKNKDILRDKFKQIKKKIRR